MPIDIDDGVYTMDLITTNERKRKKINGCCSSLSPLLHVDRLKTIMDVMRFSIGATIPFSPRYASHNSTNNMKMVDMLYPHDKLAIELKNRYIHRECFSNFSLYHNNGLTNSNATVNIDTF